MSQTDRVATPEDWRTLLDAARGGDDRALGELCDRYRAYLTLAAQGGLASDMRPKVGASDIVQDVMVEAYRDFPAFQGTSEAEFRAWMTRLVRNNLSDQGRRFHRAASRDTKRERPLEGAVEALRSATPDASASTIASRREDDDALALAVARLPERSRRLVEWRHQPEPLGFAEIGSLLNITEAAARKGYARAVEQLRGELAPAP